jgi:hypothetical protein
MGTPIDSIQPGVIRTALEGLMSQYVPVIDQINGVQKFTVLEKSGTVGVMPSKAMLAGALPSAVTGIPEGADAPVNDWALDDHSYNCVRLAQSGQITDGAKMQAAANNVEGIAQCMNLAVQNVTKDMNQMLNLVCASTSFNLQQAAGTVWSSSSATPLANMLDAVEKIGGANSGLVAIFGYQQIKHLKLHPDFTNGFMNVSSAGVPDARIAEVIAQVIGVQQVIIGSNLYNSANPGQALSLGYQFNGLAWIGYGKDLVFVEQGPFMAETERSASKGSDLCVYTRRPYIGRAHQEMGVVITGVAS